MRMQFAQSPQRQCSDPSFRAFDRARLFGIAKDDIKLFQAIAGNEIGGISFGGAQQLRNLRQKRVITTASSNEAPGTSKDERR
jgi:hypothetical protein